MARSNYIMTNNSTNTPMASGETYTGTWTYVGDYNDLVIAAYSDVSGTLYADFRSLDSGDAISSLAYDVAAGINEVHRLRITRSYARVRYVNNGTAQSVFNIETKASLEEGVLTSPLNSTIQQDADAIVARIIESEVAIGAQLFQGYRLFPKFGRNPDVDSGTVPEDVWFNGGQYTGFPTTGSAETITATSASTSDEGDITITGLDENYNLITETFSLTAGVGTTTNTFWRAHTARYDSGDSTGFNLGTITFTHTTTTANVFLVMEAGRSQTNDAGFTIPANSTGLILDSAGRIRKGTTAWADGAFWIRNFGEGPRLRRPFAMENTAPWGEKIYGGLRLSEKTDLIPRITAASTTNLAITFQYDILVITEQ